MSKFEYVEICERCEGHGKEILAIIISFDPTQNTKKYTKDCTYCYGEGHKNNIISEPSEIRDFFK